MIPISLYSIDSPRVEETSEALQLEHIVVGGLTIGFQRTVRVPLGTINSLPANLGNFPVYRVRDFQSKVPKNWNPEGFFMPMYSQEALWLSFRRNKDVRALIVAAGNINAVTGRPFQVKEGVVDLRLQEKNYMVVPPQPWLDGWKDTDNKVYQFVAAQLGSGQTVEGQLTGKEDVGGIQLVVYQQKPDFSAKHPRMFPKEHSVDYKTEDLICEDDDFELGMCLAGTYLGGGSHSRPRDPPGNPNLITLGGSSKKVSSMGLGRGGEIKQKIYPDPYGFDSWNPDSVQSMTLYLVDSRDFPDITGQKALPTPITMETYRRLGYPWFGLSDGGWSDIKGSAVFGELKPVDE